ncbi:alpha/beta hydrolase [Alterisphingorhabdus coralli]|uniref:Alpha/beta hydrolase n=1 Tax=Alterisphingorhabdus coralli TaxID=3071408 RepID=A0AA97F3V0_9SPHN|nr:alpha/beta hydrolase [Parasphingorhabdus sp. SCSIO 66989]WOE73811.1 alpha/beta hydrolase [Parasphingorhabdus sp. SCSIO 66989]
MATQPDTTDQNTPFVRPDVQACLTMMAAMEGPAMNEMTPEDARQAYLAMHMLADAEPIELAVTRDLTCPGPVGDIPLRFYDKQAERDKAGPAIVFVHGGGFVIGDLATHHSFCTLLADQLDLPLIAVDYRLAPENPFPAAAEDAIAAARWIAGSPEALGLDVTGLIPVGDSAGGNLAIVITQALTQSPAEVPVTAQMPIYPVVSTDRDWPSMQDFADGYVLTKEAMEWFDAAYQPDSESAHYNVLDQDHSQTPPTVLITTSLDPLRDQGRAYGAALLQAGITTSFYEAEGNVHDFIALRKLIPSSVHDCNAMIGRLNGILKGLEGLPNSGVPAE